MTFLAPAAIEEIRRAIVRLNRCLRAAGSDRTLSASKLSALGFLYTHPLCSAGELATAERLQPQSLTRLLNELEGDRYITRIKSDEDRRQSLLEITPEGKRILVRDMRERDQWLMKAITHLSDTEQQVLQIAAKIMNRLAEVEPEVGQSEGGHRSHEAHS
jgi:DNA-binding MarR family transcriptional regulator